MVGSLLVLRRLALVGMERSDRRVVGMGCAFVERTLLERDILGRAFVVRLIVGREIVELGGVELTR